MALAIAEAYNPSWPAQFLTIKATLEKVLATVPYLSIEHVGSTSVPDLPARPIIDIDIIIPFQPMNATQSTPTPLSAAIAALTTPTAGYEHKGEWGVPGRHAFRPIDPLDPKMLPRHNLYVVLDGCLALRNHLVLRDTLRNEENRDLREEYGRRSWQVGGY